VIGADDATGGAIAKRCAKDGYIACVTRRTAAQGARRLGTAAAMDLDTVMLIASMTKSITSAVAM
jgi:CubicO group peptidase (beta-lactamase class C family)